MLPLRRFLSRFAALGTLNRDARLLLLAIVINGVVVSAWSLFFNFLILARGYDKDFLGLVNSLPSASVLLFAIPLGLLADRWGRKGAMLAGILIYTLAYGTMVCVSDRWVILAMSFLSGLASPLFVYSQGPYMMDVSDDRNRAVLFSLSFGLVSLAGMVGSLAAGQLPALYGRLAGVGPKSAEAYQAVLLGAVLLGGLALVPLSRLGERSRAVKAGGSLPPTRLKQVFLRPVVLRLLIPNILLGSGAALIIPYWNVYFSEHYHLSDPVLGALFSASSGLIFLGSLVGPALIHTLGTKIRTVVVTGSASLVFMLLAGFSPWPWAGMAGYLLRGSLLSVAMPLLSAFGLEQISPEERGLVNTLLSLGWQGSWVIGPYISGLIQTQSGFEPLFLIATVLYGMSFGLVWLFFHQHREVAGPVAAPVEGSD